MHYCAYCKVSGVHVGQEELELNVRYLGVAVRTLSNTQPKSYQTLSSCSESSRLERERKEEGIRLYRGTSIKAKDTLC